MNPTAPPPPAPLTLSRLMMLFVGVGIALVLYFPRDDLIPPNRLGDSAWASWLLKVITASLTGLGFSGVIFAWPRGRPATPGQQAWLILSISLLLFVPLEIANRTFAVLSTRGTASIAGYCFVSVGPGLAVGHLCVTWLARRWSVRDLWKSPSWTERVGLWLTAAWAALGIGLVSLFIVWIT